MQSPTLDGGARDTTRRDPRHRGLHGARAGTRRCGRQARRHLGVRRRLLRDAHRPLAIRRPDGLRHIGRSSQDRDRLGGRCPPRRRPRSATSCAAASNATRRTACTTSPTRASCSRRRSAGQGRGASRRWPRPLRRARARGGSRSPPSRRSRSPSVSAPAGSCGGPQPPQPGAGARWALAIPEGLALATDNVPQIALSEDGRLQVAVAVDAQGETRLLLRTVDEAEPHPVPETEGALAPFFSPDGAWIGFFRERELLKVPTVGGAVVRIAAISGQANQIRGASWSRDGFIYFAPNVAEPISRISASGSTAEVVTKLDVARDERTHRWPQALPDGKAVLYTSDTTASTGVYDDARIEALGTGDRRAPGSGRGLRARRAAAPAAGIRDSRAAARSPSRSTRRRAASGGRALCPKPSSSGCWPRPTSPPPAGRSTRSSSGAPRSGSACSAASWRSTSCTGSRATAARRRLPPRPRSTTSPFCRPTAAASALVGGVAGRRLLEFWVAELERGVVSRPDARRVGEQPLVWTPDGSRIAYRRPAPRARRTGAIRSRLAGGGRPAAKPETLHESRQLALPSEVQCPTGGRLVPSEPKAGTQTPDVFPAAARERRPQARASSAARWRSARPRPARRPMGGLRLERERRPEDLRALWVVSRRRRSLADPTDNGAEPRWSPDR